MSMSKSVIHLSLTSSSPRSQFYRLSNTLRMPPQKACTVDNHQALFKHRVNKKTTKKPNPTQNKTKNIKQKTDNTLVLTGDVKSQINTKLKRPQGGKTPHSPTWGRLGSVAS